MAELCEEYSFFFGPCFPLFPSSSSCAGDVTEQLKTESHIRKELRDQLPPAVTEQAPIVTDPTPTVTDPAPTVTDPAPTVTGPPHLQ